MARLLTRSHRFARLASLAVLLFASAEIANAQVVCHVENGGPDYEDFSSVGAVTFGIQFSVQETLQIRGAKIFTGEKTGTMTLAIYDDNAGAPGAQLTTTNFACVLPVGFQGADFSLHPLLLPGKKYWLGWDTIGGAQSPMANPGADLGQPFRISLDGGQTWGDLQQSQDRNFKFQLICDCPEIPSPYGLGCAGSGGFTPQLHADGCAIAGNNVSITLDHALGGSTATLFFGLSAGTSAIGGTGCALLVTPILPFFVTVPLGGVGAGAGNITLIGALPPGSTNFTFTMQALVPDGGVPRGFSASNGLKVQIY